EREGDAHQEGPQDHEATEASDLVGEVEEDLGSPLLVDPRMAGGDERQRIRVQQVAGGEHALPGPELVAEVGHAKARGDRAQDGESDRTDRPDLWKADPPHSGTDTRDESCVESRVHLVKRSEAASASQSPLGPYLLT